MSTTLRGRVAFGLSVVAVLYGLVLVAAAFLAPAYSEETARTTPGGVTRVSSETSTLVGENGLWVVAVAAVPFLLACASFLFLRRACSRGSASARAGACAVGLVLLAYVVVTGFSIGLWAGPLLLVVCAAILATPVGQEPRPPGRLRTAAPPA